MYCPKPKLCILLLDMIEFLEGNGITVTLLMCYLYEHSYDKCLYMRLYVRTINQALEDLIFNAF
jgi:hypothetical protein